MPKYSLRRWAVQVAELPHTCGRLNPLARQFGWMEAPKYPEAPVYHMRSTSYELFTDYYSLNKNRAMINDGPSIGEINCFL